MSKGFPIGYEMAEKNANTQTHTNKHFRIHISRDWVKCDHSGIFRICISKSLLKLILKIHIFFLIGTNLTQLATNPTIRLILPSRLTYYAQGQTNTRYYKVHMTFFRGLYIYLKNPRWPPKKKIRILIFSTLNFEKVKTLKEQKIILSISWTFW